MSSRIWKELYPVIVRESRAMGRRKRMAKYSDSLIVAMYFWMVLHDRTQQWACERSSYHGAFRPRELPSPSRFSRRLRSESCSRLLRRVVESFRGSPQVGFYYLDSRPLPIGACSKDADGKAGRVYGGFARGYRLHALIDEKGVVTAWRVAPMNVAEARIAPELLDEAPPRSKVLADANYDRAPLYEGADAVGVTLLAKPRKNAGQGHRRQCPVRLAAIALWRKDAEKYSRMRWHVERAQAHQSIFAGGLQPLPTWIRRLPRVKRWVAAKIVIYHARLAERSRAA